MLSRVTHAVRVLVADDEKNIRHSLRVCLEGLGATVVEAPAAAAALAAAEREALDLCFLDLRLGDESGVDLIVPLLERRPGLSIVMITAYATVETAVLAIRRGARDYLPKPFTPAQVRHAVENVLAARRLEARIGDLEARLRESVPEAELATRSPAMRAALDLAFRAAPSDAPILLRGRSGTGKGVVARAIHARSARAEGPFATVHCPMLTPELLASELFGHVRGAFTGAVADQAGKVETARGGTLFFDEVSEIAPSLQAKLLRFVQDQEYERVGETRTRRADVRVIAATNRDLAAAVASGAFREDLLFRLNVIEVTIPPLRERPEDILPLAEHFLGFFARAQRRRDLRLLPGARERLLAYPWPGNVRELRNAIERAAILSTDDAIGVEALPDALRSAAPPPPRVGGDVSLEALEQEHIERVVARAATLDEAARILGIDPATLYRKRKKYRDLRAGDGAGGS
jgi:NtrC-family two-component system response regulator AlgB